VKVCAFDEPKRVKKKKREGKWEKGKKKNHLKGSEGGGTQVVVGGK